MRQWVKYMQNQAYAPPMKQAADLLRALADEERLRILNLLSDEPEGACVCELVDGLRLPQYQVSRQLGMLKGAGLVEAHKRGNWAYYRIRPDLPPLAAVMLRSSSEAMRGRVMGVRMLAIWGLPLGLLAAGPIIAHLGYAATTLLYSGLGLAATLAIGYGWRRALWHRSAAANAAYAG